MYNQITHKCSAVAPAFPFSKSVCKSQNRKCVCKSQNTIKNVSHKIVNVSVSHKIVVYRVLVRRADRLVLTMVCNGPLWCLVDYMLRNDHGTWSKTTKTGFRVFCDLHTFLAWLTDTFKIYLNWPYFYLCQFEHIFGFALSVYLCAQIFPFGEKNYTTCIFAVILIFLLPADHVVKKMSVSHANENEIYILNFILLKITDYRFL